MTQKTNKAYILKVPESISICKEYLKWIDTTDIDFVSKTVAYQELEKIKLLVYIVLSSSLSAFRALTVEFSEEEFKKLNPSFEITLCDFEEFKRAVFIHSCLLEK